MVHSIVRCWNHRVSNASLHPDVLHSLITAHFSDLLRCGILYSGIVNMQNKMLSVNKHTIFCPTGEHIVSFFGFLYSIPKRDIRKKKNKKCTISDDLLPPVYHIGYRFNRHAVSMQQPLALGLHFTSRSLLLLTCLRQVDWRDSFPLDKQTWTSDKNDDKRVELFRNRFFKMMTYMMTWQ